MQPAIQVISVACAFCLALSAGNLSVPEKLIADGHWKRARAIVEARFREAPDDPLANFLLSQIRFAFGDRESTLAFAEKAVALDNGVAKYHRQVAEVLGVMAQHSNVWQQLVLARRFRKEIDLALMLDPFDIQASRDLMEFYLLAPGIAGGDPRKAAATAGRISSIHIAEGYLAQARLAEFHKQTQTVEEYLRKAAGSQPGYYLGHIALARFDLALPNRNRDGAESEAREAIALDPDRVEAYSILAEVYADRGSWTDLDALLPASMSHVPDDLTPYYRAAERLLETGRELPRAERYLRTYLTREAEGNEPAPAEAHWKLGLVLEKEARHAEAIAEWSESVRLDPASPASRDLKRLGHIRGAARLPTFNTKPSQCSRLCDRAGLTMTA